MIDTAIQKYSDQLKKLDIGHTIVEHPELKTPSEVQGYLGLTLADGLSTMIMKADDGFVAVIRRDDTRLDFKKVKNAVKVKNLRMANPDEFTTLTGMPIGAARVVNPGFKTLLDTRLFEKELLTGGSGSFTCSIRYRARDLKKIPQSVVVSITEETKQEGLFITGHKRVVSGITPSGDGTLHIGNYLGAVKQFIEIARSFECFLFVADMHALTTIQHRDQLTHNVETLILNELALLKGFLSKEDFDRIVFYRQSDIGIHGELQSILNNVTPLGLIKRAHAYKDKLAKDVSEDDINLGLFNYPILMAADILLYKPELVPVGKDQKQHVEITRDIAQRFNKTFPMEIGVRPSGTSRPDPVFKLPEAYIPDEVAVVLGTDGKRKMSKSLGNIISIFEDEEIIKKQVMSTYTDPTRIHASDPGHIEGNMVFTYLDFFADKTKNDELKKAYREGKVADVEVKNYLYESLMKFFAPARNSYQELVKNPSMVQKILRDGAEKARVVATQTMTQVRDAIGLVNAYSVATNFQTGGNISIDDFARVEIRVGKVIEAKNKEGSDKLIRLVVDFSLETRTIFTGVRGFGYLPSDFLNKQFFFITNLAPRKMMDEESQGMILAVDPSAGSGQAKKPIFISAEGLPVGAKIR